MSDIELRARQAAAGIRGSIGDVQPRGPAAVIAKRRMALGVALGLALAVGAATFAVIGHRSSNTVSTASLLPAPTSPPVPTPTARFAPLGLSVALTIPVTWTVAPPSSGFSYVMRDLATPRAFLLANRGPASSSSASQVGRDRSRFLKRGGARIDSVTPGTVDGHPAVRLRYLLERPGFAGVDDTEYDILLGNPPTEDVIIVLGEPAPRTDTGLLDRVASTIQVQG